MALENVAHRLGTDRHAQVGEGADNPVVAPRTILLGHADDQGLNLLVDRRAAGSLVLWGAIKLLGHELAVPGEDGIGLDNGCQCLEGLFAQLLTDLGQRPAFAVRQPYTARDLAAENTIFRHQVLIAQQQFLIDSPRDICEEEFPVHCLFPTLLTVSLDGEYRRW